MYTDADFVYIVVIPQCAPVSVWTNLHVLLINWTALLGTKERFEHCCLFGLCSRSGGNSCIITLL